MDTIFAESTAKGRAGVSVLRISGPNAAGSVAAFGIDIPPPRQAALRTLHDAEGQLIDQALALYFPAPSSFTGEDVIELHLHGSIAVVARVSEILAAGSGMRMADPGEFTRRALENGKLDLAQVEGLADLIDAETEAQRKQAVRLFDGALGEKVEAWRRDLIRAAALLEATIDFADEDVPVDVTPEVGELVGGVIADLRSQIAGTRISERLRSGFEVAIVGPPNAGKSTLLNRLAGRDAAITSEIAGTTRDVIEVRMDLAGLPVTILDTAGLREASDAIESLGVLLALSRAEKADLRVVLADESFKVPFELREDDIHVRPKADLSKGDGLAVSGKTGEGIERLVDCIGNALSNRVASAGLATRERHRQAMTNAVADLQRGIKLLQAGPGQHDLAAEELRHACRALDSIVGRIDVENLLDEIFSSFCIGK